MFLTTLLKNKEKALSLFHQVYKTSKAYKNFIDSHDINPSSIKTVEDFERIPIMDRHNYINKYSLEDRLYNGKKLSDFYMISASSGSTGQPTFWPRDYTNDVLLEQKKEALYKEHFQISKKNTLCVIAFALGSWTGGMLTAKLSWAVSKNNKFTVVTPGINRQEAILFIQKLNQLYDQVILLGYPPFLTDLIEYAREIRFDLSKVRVKIMYTGERVSERWRNYIVAQISPNKNRHDVVGFYACSDTGIIGTETKFCIDLLDFAYKNKEFCKELFDVNDPPSFVSYDPTTKFLECINDEIIITADQPIPLIRYNIHDRGKILSRDKLEETCKKFSIRVNSKDINKHYVYLLGRSDAVLLAANIYVDDIKYCLENSKLKNKFTLNFKYGKEEMKDFRYRLRILIFLKKGILITNEEKKYLYKEFYQNLLKINNDFKVIAKTTKMYPIKFEFEQDAADKFQTTKLKYFL